MSSFEELFTAENVYKATLQNQATFVGLMGQEKVKFTECFTKPELILARKRVETGLRLLDYFDQDLNEAQRNMRETLKMNHQDIQKYRPEGLEDNG